MARRAFRACGVGPGPRIAVVISVFDVSVGSQDCFVTALPSKGESNSYIASARDHFARLARGRKDTFGGDLTSECVPKTDLGRLRLVTALHFNFEVAEVFGEP